jgi:hypothetical protein
VYVPYTGATNGFVSVGIAQDGGDSEQRSITVHAPAASHPADSWPAAGVVTVPSGDVAALKEALSEMPPAVAAAGTIKLSAGVWHMGTLDRLYVPDGIVLQGAGMNKTVLMWPQQTGKDCSHTGWPTKKIALVQGGTSKLGTKKGWGLQDLAVVVQGGFVQNDTKAFCPAIAPCTAPGCTGTVVGMTIKRVNISAVAPTGGVDSHAGVVQMMFSCAIYTQMMFSYRWCWRRLSRGDGRVGQRHHRLNPHTFR